MAQVQLADFVVLATVVGDDMVFDRMGLAT